MTAATPFRERRRQWLKIVPAVAGASLSFPVLAQPTSKELLAQLWQEYKRRFVKADGSVVDTGNKGITHTEGLGVSMLVSVELDDAEAFKALAKFSDKLKRPDSLYSWRWEPGKGVTDRNNATDGDLYIAWAYTRAVLKSRRADWAETARNLVAAIDRQCSVVTRYGRVLVPGTEGFLRQDGPVIVNPSYWVFPAFKELRAIGASSWDEVYADARKLLQSPSWSSAGLPADWLTLQDTVMPWAERPARFGYEAIRVPLFLVWAGLDAEPCVRAVARHVSQPDFPAWVSLDGKEKAEYVAPPGFQAVAALVKKAVYGTPLSAQAFRIDDDYYSSSLVLLSALAATSRGWL